MLLTIFNFLLCISIILAASLIKTRKIQKVNNHRNRTIDGWLMMLLLHPSLQCGAMYTPAKRHAFFVDLLI